MRYWLNKANRTDQEVVSRGERPLHGDENGKMDRYGFYAVEITEEKYHELYNQPSEMR